MNVMMQYASSVARAFSKSLTQCASSVTRALLSLMQYASSAHDDLRQSDADSSRTRFPLQCVLLCMYTGVSDTCMCPKQDWVSRDS